jgi:uncharacterized short protein YbdD (DUF466 family)
MMSFTQFAGRVAETARLMVGLPPYANYCEHMASHHPGEPLMSEAEFFRNRQDAHYGAGGARRCC